MFFYRSITALFKFRVSYSCSNVEATIKNDFKRRINCVYGQFMRLFTSELKLFMRF